MRVNINSKMPIFVCPRCKKTEDTRPFIGVCAICRRELKDAAESHEVLNFRG